MNKRIAVRCPNGECGGLLLPEMTVPVFWDFFTRPLDDVFKGSGRGAIFDCQHCNRPLELSITIR